MSKDLVKGFMVCGEVLGQETLYLRTTGGDVFTTGLIARTNEFSQTGRKWSKADAIPQGAEFIGNYPNPVR